MADLGQKIGNAVIQVGTSFIGFGDNLASDIANSLSSKAFAVGNVLEQFGQAVFTKFSVPLLAATGANIAQFQALDREIRTVLTLFGTAPSLVDDTFRDMAAGVREVSIAVGGLEKDIAEGLYQTISAGVPRTDAFDFLEVAQQAAIADRTSDLTTAVDGLTTVVNAYGLEADNARVVSDALFQTVALGKTTFGELSSDIGRVAPLAASAGVEFQELFSVIGALTLQGLKTSEAISFLRAAITGVLRPTDELKQIFNDVGFASAEAAIPVLGLQGAFTVVTRAAGGSTSRLQELIGTSEGVSAILGITGQNAETFGRTLDGVTNSAGATERAFSIVDEGLGRRFGKLTEAFDRLGNTFGAFAGEFVAPVISLITDVVTNVTSAFENLEPIVDGLSIAFGAFIDVLDTPVIKGLISTIATLGVAFFGLTGTLGLVALAFSKVLIPLANAAGAVKVFKLLRTVVGRLGGVSTTAAAALANMANRLLKTKLAAGTASGAYARLLVFVTSLKGQLLAASLAFGAITIAIGAAVAGIALWLRRQKEIRDSLDSFGKSSDVLAESLGLVAGEIAIIADIDTGEIEDNLAVFEVTNLPLINELRTFQDVLGEKAATDFAESLLAQKIFEGNAPDQLTAFKENIEELLDLDIGLDLENVGSALDVFNEFAEGVGVKIEALGSTDGAFASFSNQIPGVVNGLRDLFAAGLQSGNLDVFSDFLASARENLNETQAEVLGSRFLDRLNDELREKGIELDLTAGQLFDGQSLLDSLESQGLTTDGVFVIPSSLERPEIPFPEGTFISPDRMADFERTGQGLSDVQQEIRKQFGLTITEARKLTEEGIGDLQDLGQTLDTVFSDASTQVSDALNEIRTQVFEQQPLLTVYKGAVEQTFTAWRKGQQQFREDLGLIDEARGKLVEQFGGDSGLVSLFDAQPISQQAWLARLGDDNFQAAVDELKATYEATLESGDIRVGQSAEDVVAGVIGDVASQFDELTLQALASGAITAESWERAFSRQAQGWLDAASFYVDNVERILAGVNTTVPGFSFGSNLPGAQPGGSGGIPGFTGPSGVTFEGDIIFQGGAENPAQAAADLLGTIDSTLISAEFD